MAHRAAVGRAMTLQRLKDDRAADRIIVDVTEDEEEDERLSGIRCPLCGWRPSASSLWHCDCVDTPEPRFEGCGTMWNTFLTRGRCPGCRHQWRWTSCHRCEEWSLHDDWYEETDRRR
jgi:hypothetical protein